jgi:hypothetical protein
MADSLKYKELQRVHPLIARFWIHYLISLLPVALISLDYKAKPSRSNCDL